MSTAPLVSAHDKSGDDINAEEGVRKRTRAKLTCLSCKRRKIKCDKTFPCSPCIVRKETSLCQYEDGVVPLERTHSIPVDTLMELHSRLAHLVPTSSRDQYFPNTTPPPPDYRRAGDEERAFNALEDLVPLSELEQALRPTSTIRFSPSPSLSEFETWPSVESLCVTTRSLRWHQNMLYILEALPTTTHINALVDFYFKKPQILRRYLCENVFRSEIDNFRILRARGMYMSIDPAWLALLIAVLWASSYFMADEPPASLEQLGIDPSANPCFQPELASRLFEALETAFICAGWLIRPQFRILQAILVAISLNRSGPYHSGGVSGPQAEWTRCMWFATAVRICEALDLHQCETLEDISKLRDPALPNSRPLYSTEVARRAFYNVIYIDTFNICAFFDGPRRENPHYFPDGSFSTPQPGNYNDDTLLDPPSSVQPQSPCEITPFIWDYHVNILTQHWRQVLSLLRSTEKASYGSVLELDLRLRQSYGLFLNFTTKLNLSQIGVEFAVLDSSYQQRFLRLHRPYLLRSYRDDEYVQSRGVLLSSARQIVQIHRKLLQESDGDILVRSSPFLFVHHISAALVIFVHGLFDVTSRQEMRAELVRSSEVFHQAYLKGHRLNARGAIKGYCVTMEMLKSMDNSPTNPELETMGKALRDMEQRASINERQMLQCLIKPTSVHPRTSRRLSISTFGSSDPRRVHLEEKMDSQLEENARDFSWDIDWGLFMRNL